MNDDTRQRLIEAAGAMFAERGYEATSVRDICQQAGANIAAVNYHFGDKRTLYVAAVRHAQTCADGVHPEGPWPEEMPPTQRLRTFIRTMLERKLAENRPAWHLEIMLREMAHPTEACAAVVEDYVRPMANGLRSILRDLLGDDFPDDRGKLIGFSIVGQVLFYYVHQPVIRLLIGDDEYNRLSVEQLANHIADFSLAAMGLARPLSDPPVSGPSRTASPARPGASVSVEGDAS